MEELERTQQHVVQQERLRALGQMASGIAHDFNNALTIIQGFSELFLMAPETLDDKATAMDNLQRIHLAAKDAAEVVRRMREFYRKRDTREIRMPVKLPRLVEEAILLTEPRWHEQAQARGVTIRIEKDLPDVPSVLANEAELREVLTNLIFNAVDALPDGGAITFRTRREDGRVALAVSDTGIGMPDEVRQHCFDPFYSTKGPEGSGLGLSAAYGIIDRHEGTIAVSSEPGEGATFTIRLPVAHEPVAADGPEEAEAPGRPLHILVAEDDPDIRELVVSHLTEAGHTIEAAVNGVEGLERFSAGWFDVVVTDRAMPEMGGDQFAAAVKGIAPGKPVIMLTGFGDIMDSAGERPAGVDLIVTKPISREALLRGVQAAASRKPPAKVRTVRRGGRLSGARRTAGPEGRGG